MAGALHRVIRIATCLESDGSGRARAAIEDDFHHFRVGIRHDGIRVTATEAEAPRGPFSLCGAAGNRLDELIGTALTNDVVEASGVIAQRLQCTHQFDVALLAITAASRSTPRRRYEAIIPDDWIGSDDGGKTAILFRDDEQVLEWRLAGDRIMSPEPFAGRSVGAGFTAFASEHLDPDASEAALVLRRAVFISSGRARRLDDLHHPPPNNGCWVQQPERRLASTRNYGTQRDYSADPELLTATDDDWLAFAAPTEVKND